NAVQDHGIIAHRTTDESALAGERRRRAFAHDPQITFAMTFPPGIVVMVVDRIEHLAAYDRAHLLDHPLATRIGIMARQRHAGEILLPEVAVLVQHGRLNVDAVLAAGCADEGGRGLVAEATRTEMHADPH